MLDLTKGSARTKIAPDQASALLATGTVILDDRRHRPKYFNGRFLTANDLTRDQNYFLTRQADLCQAAGFGIVNGLTVTSASSTSIQIAAGQGVTPSGELVVLTEARSIAINDIAETQRLDAAFGLAPIPRQPSRNRSGLYIVALRPVEFTANPIAAYPTSVTGSRSTQDGDIIEAVAITLIPYADAGLEDDPTRRRGRLAHEIFVKGATRNLAADALPLAMLALDRGVIRWIDLHLVRREVGTEYDDLLGLETTPRALREAHFRQYAQQLQDVLALRRSSNRSPQFSASEHFFGLPAVGPMPASAIDSNNLSQIYFPPAIEVELSFVPSDEVAALLDESLPLPPIDLTLTEADLESTSVLVLIPVNRQRFAQLQAVLRSQPDRLATQRLPIATSGYLAKRSPIDALRNLKLPPIVPTLPPAAAAIDAEWRRALAEVDLVWYVRRRNLPDRMTAAIASIRSQRNEFPAEQQWIEQLTRLNLHERFYDSLMHFASQQAQGEIMAMMASDRFAQSRLLIEGAFSEFEAKRRELDRLGREADARGEGEIVRRQHPNEELGRGGRLTRYSVAQIAARFGDPFLGEGILRLEAIEPLLKNTPATVTLLAQSERVPELDRLARLMPNEALRDFAARLQSIATGANPDSVAIAQLIDTTLKEIES